jgi:hypothetical protein
MPKGTSRFHYRRHYCGDKRAAMLVKSGSFSINVTITHHIPILSESTAAYWNRVWMPIKKVDGELVKPKRFHYNLNGYWGSVRAKLQREVSRSHPT